MAEGAHLEDGKRFIQKGDVVAYKEEGYCKVTAVFKKTVNLGGIFNGKIYHKGVPLSEVREAHDEWYAKWQNSESYRCM